MMTETVIIEEAATGVIEIIEHLGKVEIVQTPATEVVEVVSIGHQGIPGKSAYEIWLAEGNTGSEGDFLNSLAVGAEPPDDILDYIAALDAGLT